MVILRCEDYERLKRSWRRRNYQKGISFGKAHRKRKLRIIRLGGAAPARWLWRIKRTPKLLLKIFSPIKVLVKFHDAYVDMMIRLTNKMANPNSNGGFIGTRRKKVAKTRQVLLVSPVEEVDSKLVQEIYKNLAASR